MVSESSPINPSTATSSSSSTVDTHWTNFQKLPWLEIFFLYYMAIAGGVAMTVSYNISDLAANCGETATSMGIVFLSEAIGGVVGGVSSVYLFHYCPGNWILIGVGGLLGCTLITMPFITSVIAMNFAYFLVGAFALLIQIGCIHLVRWIQRDTAGHWLGLTQAALSGGSTIVFISDWALNIPTIWEFVILAMFVWTVSLVFISVPFSSENAQKLRNVELENQESSATRRDLSNSQVVDIVNRESDPTNEDVESSVSMSASATPSRNFYYNTSTLDASPGPTTSSNTRIDEMPSCNNNDEDLSWFEAIFNAPHYHAEIVVGCAAALINGCGLMMTSYFSSFVSETGVEATTLAKYQLSLFWTMVTIGRLIGTADQYLYVNDDNLLWHTTVWIATSTLKTIIWLILWNHARGLWAVSIILGFCFGPLMGYIFDWVNRLTTPSEASTTIMMLVTFVGGHSMMYLCAAIWELGGGPKTLIVMIMISLILAIPLLWAGKYVSYLKKFRFVYGRLSSVEI